MGEAIVITSGKGGSGKSTLTVGLGRALAARGKQVVMVDMDMGMRSLDLMLGVQDRVVYDVSDVIDGISRIKQALIRVAPDQEMYVLNAAQTRGSDAITPVQMERIVKKLKEKFDYVLIDCPAGVGKGFRNACQHADSAILVVLPDRVSVRDAERVVGLLRKCDVAKVRLVANRLPMYDVPQGELSAAKIEEALGLSLLGWIPDDGAAVRHGFSEIEDIARRLMGEDVPLKPYAPKGYWARVRRAIFTR